MADEGTQQAAHYASYVIMMLGSATLSSSVNRTNGAPAILGLGLVASGSISRSVSLSEDLINEDTDLGFYLEDSNSKSLMGTAKASQFLEKIEMDALLDSMNPNLALSVPSGEMIKELGFNVKRTGDLILKAKSLADHLDGGREFGEKMVFIYQKDLTHEVGPLSSKELFLIKNYLRLRNVVVNDKA